MIDQDNNKATTCEDVDSEELLQEFAITEELHSFKEAKEQSITDLHFCEVVFVEEECSYCSARLRGVRITGDPPQKMRQYKRLIYELYEAFYENPRSHDHITLSGGFANADIKMQMVMQTEISRVIKLGYDDAQDSSAKQSEQKIWTQILGPEHAGND